MGKKLTLSDLAKLLAQSEIIELEDVRIKGEIELELGTSKGVAFPVALVQALSSALGSGTMPRVPEVAGIAELLSATFNVAKAEWNGQIEEVTIGATSADGGTREQTVTVGGEQSLPFYNFDARMPHPPVISVDCFDMPIPLAKGVIGFYE
jgi:acetyl-CoA decarbonylase/synthase complex subunit delta